VLLLPLSVAATSKYHPLLQRQHLFNSPPPMMPHQQQQQQQQNQELWSATEIDLMRQHLLAKQQGVQLSEAAVADKHHATAGGTVHKRQRSQSSSGDDEEGGKANKKKRKKTAIRDASRITL